MRVRGDGRGEYRCGYHYARGDMVCRNKWTMPMGPANAALIRVVQRDVLAPGPKLRHDPERTAAGLLEAWAGLTASRHLEVP